MILDNIKRNMKTKIKSFAILLGFLMFFISGYAAADCVVEEPSSRTNIDILSNTFPSVNHLAKQMESCSGGKLRVRAKLTKEHVELKKLAMSSKGKASYQIIQLSNNDFLEYVQRGWITPITQYVEKYKSKYNFDDIPQAAWDTVTYKGEIYVIPVQQNLQHFFYRSDLFEKHNIKPPRNYRDVVRAAAKLKKAEGIDYPIGQTFGRGWSLATEFTNIYMSLGGEFFDGDLHPVFNTDKAGKEAIKIMKSMLPYMSPNALSFSNDDTMVAFQQGKSVLGNLWASRAGNMDDAKVSQFVGKVAYSAAPAAKGKGTPASTVFWDGYAIPANVPASQRELAFQIIAEATDSESMLSGGDLAFFSRESVNTNADLVKENRYWPALLDTVKGGAPAYPGSPYFSIAHTAIGTYVADALSDKLTAAEALNKAANEYTKEAKVKGFIK